MQSNQILPALPGVEHRFDELNGVRLHYATSGHGPLMIFLHGFPEFWYQWKDQLVEFGRDFHVVAPDMRGYNLSSSPRDVGQYRIKTLVDDIRCLADSLEADKFVLVGHDWGGLIAWAFSLYYPERLRQLVILNAAHPAIQERELRENPAQQFASQYMILFNTADAESILAEHDYAAVVDSVLGDGLQKGYVTDAERELYLAVWRDGHSLTGGLNYYRAAHLQPASVTSVEWCAREALTPELTSFDVETPTLVIWGLQDPYLLGGNLSGLGSYVRNLKTVFFNDTGHWTNRAKSKEVNAAIREFLETAP